jgi:hypothetical protein
MTFQKLLPEKTIKNDPKIFYEDLTINSDPVEQITTNDLTPESVRIKEEETKQKDVTI